MFCDFINCSSKESLLSFMPLFYNLPHHRGIIWPLVIAMTPSLPRFSKSRRALWTLYGANNNGRARAWSSLLELSGTEASSNKEQEMAVPHYCWTRNTWDFWKQSTFKGDLERFYDFRHNSAQVHIFTEMCGSTNAGMKMQWFCNKSGEWAYFQSLS